MGYELSKFRLVLKASGKPAATYSFVITRLDRPNWSEAGATSFKTLDAAAEAGRMAINRLEK